MALSIKSERDRRNTLADVALILAEYVHCFGGDISSLLWDLETETQEQLWTIQKVAALERAIDDRAEREGLRY